MKNIKKYVFVALICLFCVFGLPKVNAANTTHSITSGAYTIRYKNVNVITDDIFTFQEIPIGVNSTLSPGEYLLLNGSAYFSINGGYQPSKYYTFYVRLIGSQNLSFRCNSDSDYTQQNNYSWKFSGGDTYTDFTSFRTSCDTANNYLYITFSIQAPASVGNSFVLYWETLGNNFLNSIYFNDTDNTNGTISFLVDKVESSDSDNSVIINQNQTIINQNQEQINQNNQIIEGQGKIFNSIVGLTEEFKNSQNATNDLITDETPPGLEVLDDAVGWLPPGPVDSILNLPLSVFQSLSSSLGKSCTPVLLPIPYINKTLELPCVSSLYAKMGVSDYIETVGIIASAFILLGYLLNLYKWVDDQLSLRENTWNDMDQWGGV